MAGGACYNFDAFLALARNLWAAARELDGILDDRDDAALVANKHWVGPHQETFDKDLTTDSVDEQALIGLLERSANDWAQVWADSMNEENKENYDRAVDGADSTLEWLPGFSDRPVTDLKHLTAPDSPEFEPPADAYYVNTES